MQNGTTPERPPIKTETFKDRLVNEREQLNIKIESLFNFLRSDKIKSIDKAQAMLLGIQLHAMKTYGQILTERIALL